MNKSVGYALKHTAAVSVICTAAILTGYYNGEGIDAFRSRLLALLLIVYLHTYNAHRDGMKDAAQEQEKR